MSPYAGCQGQSIGRVLHFLYHYCGLLVAEYAEIGDREVKYNGKKIAFFYFRGDVPIFEFVNPDYNEVQSFKRDEAIRDGAPRIPEGTREAVKEAILAFCKIGDANYLEYPTSHVAARSISKAASVLETWFDGNLRNMPKEDYLRAIELGVKAMREIESIRPK